MPRITPEITENPLILVNGIVLLALTVLTAVFISLYASNVYKGNKKKAVLFFTAIAALTALSLFCFFGCAATTVKGIIFCLLLAFSSYEDIKTRECENYVHLMIVIAAFIGTDKKIELLSKYYGDVLTVTQTSVITKDYKILPLTEIIPAENKYSKYDFGDIEIPEAISKKIN